MKASGRRVGRACYSSSAGGRSPALIGGVVWSTRVPVLALGAGGTGPGSLRGTPASSSARSPIPNRPNRTKAAAARRRHCQGSVPPARLTPPISSPAKAASRHGRRRAKSFITSGRGAYGARGLLLVPQYTIRGEALQCGALTVPAPAENGFAPPVCLFHSGARIYHSIYESVCGRGARELEQGWGGVGAQGDFSSIFVQRSGRNHAFGFWEVMVSHWAILRRFGGVLGPRRRRGTAKQGQIDLYSCSPHKPLILHPCYTLPRTRRR